MAPDVPKKDQPVLRAEDFRVRFAVADFDLSTDHLQRAPALFHVRGFIGTTSAEFDFRLVPVIAHGSSRSRPMPMLWYESSTVAIRSIERLQQGSLNGQTLRFGIPVELWNFASVNTKCLGELFVRGKWYTSGYQPAEEGISIPINQ